MSVLTTSVFIQKKAMRLYWMFSSECAQTCKKRLRSLNGGNVNITFNTIVPGKRSSWKYLPILWPIGPMGSMGAGSNGRSRCGLISTLSRLAPVATETERNWRYFWFLRRWKAFGHGHWNNIPSNSNIQDTPFAIEGPIVSTRIGTSWWHRENQ